MWLVNKKIILVGIIVFLLLGVVFWQQMKKPVVDSTNKNNNHVDWQTYHNDDLGVEFKYPTQIFIQNGACKLIDGDYRILYAPVDTKILAKDNIIYIDQAYNYDFGDKGCFKKENDLMQDPIALKIIIKDNVFNNQDLNKVVKEFYGNAGDQCKINEQKLSSQPGVYDIFVLSDGQNIDISHCFIDYWTVMKYYPAKNKLMFVDLGMEHRFWGNEDGSTTYDQAMIDSFKFID